MQNGRELLSVHSQELDDLSISIRIRLLTPPPVSIIWLLLSADLCLNKFLPLPNTLQQFYASHLDLSQEDPPASYSEVSYGSWKKSPEKEDSKNVSESDLSLAEKVSQNLSQLNLSHDEDVMKPKLRPILGAGAGLLRQEQQGSVLTANQDSFETWTAKSLSKRYDLNSWRQNEEEPKEEDTPVFNPTVLPPNLSSVQNFPKYTPEYPKPDVGYLENYAKYLQQGDGTYIQSQYQDRPENTSFTQQGDCAFPTTPFPPLVERQNSVPDRSTSEPQKSNSRRPVENWRMDKPDSKEDPNRSKQRNWPRKTSEDSVNEAEPSKEDDTEQEGKFRISRASSREIPRQNRRSSTDTDGGKPKRHVTDVPRSQKYWDHDDRCDIDYTS